ncbi:hypothetical protein [Bremerella alba]|uniref:Uncharacterized protein n=1 Tax=Bremerella alba TaxID=980252 RepID=A0A7V8V3J0_9BACT|nr:hypothetical protein [Bremerella alba]MBA2114289.1 hypothetical protein [Bremerella alba]
MLRDRTLRKLSKSLFGWNYVVHLRLYRPPYISEADVNQYVATTLGSEAIVGGSQQVTADEMMDDIETSIRHRGDASYGPKQGALESRAFKELLDAVLSHFKEVSTNADRIELFWLEEGHLDYPVFWDFAYLIASPSGCEIFIGSSSD